MNDNIHKNEDDQTNIDKYRVVENIKLFMIIPFAVRYLLDWEAIPESQYVNF